MLQPSCVKEGVLKNSRRLSHKLLQDIMSFHSVHRRPVSFSMLLTERYYNSFLSRTGKAYHKNTALSWYQRSRLYIYTERSLILKDLITEFLKVFYSRIQIKLFLRGLITFINYAISFLKIIDKRYFMFKLPSEKERRMKCRYADKIIWSFICKDKLIIFYIKHINRTSVLAYRPRNIKSVRCRSSYSYKNFCSFLLKSLKLIYKTFPAALNCILGLERIKLIVRRPTDNNVCFMRKIKLSSYLCYSPFKHPARGPDKRCTAFILFSPRRFTYKSNLRFFRIRHAITFI